ncbi:putative GDSL esterase/lipase [Cocos nucifera]|nr:putative GDSL esterase/lipase [Cocos nucifera]
MRPKLVLFGDSITEESFGDGGWGAALAHHFSRTVDVVLRGYSGYNTRWALRVVERAMDGVCLEGKSPMAVTVFFGANDASLADRSSGFQHVPLPEYQNNLRAICSFLKERWPSTVVILITPPPVDENGRLRYPFGDNPSGLPERTNESAGAYAKACIAVAKESGIPVIDIWSKMQQFPNWEKVFLRYPFGDNPSGLPERTNESAGAYAKACIAVAKESGIPVIDIWSKMQQFPNWEKVFLSSVLADGFGGVANSIFKTAGRTNHNQKRKIRSEKLVESTTNKPFNCLLPERRLPKSLLK